MPQYERGNQDVRDWTLRDQTLATSLNEVIPESVSFVGILIRPGFVKVECQFRQPEFLPRHITAKTRSDFDERDRAQPQTARRMSFQTSRRRSPEIRISQSDIQLDAGVNDPSHRHSSPSRSSRINSSVVLRGKSGKSR